MKKMKFSNLLLWFITMLLFLSPFLFALILLPGEDSFRFMIWAVGFIFLSILIYPLMAKLFPHSPDQGYAYGHILGLILPAFIIWTLSYLGLPLFSPWPIRVLLLITLIAMLALLFRPKSHPIKLTFTPLHLFESALFLLAFFLWTYVRSHKPELYDLEKFMDFGFMMSMWRADTLPAQDMWLAGHSINYYYFGQYLFTFMSKLTGIHPQFSYNLSMAASFAMTFIGSFALVRDFLYVRSREHRMSVVSATPNRWTTVQSHVLPSLFGFLAAVFLTLTGNSHAFFYKPGELGNRFLQFLERTGYSVGNTHDFFFSDSTRFIGYNPPSQDKTIHEFPYYSYLVGDLHAHMVNLSVVIVLIALLFWLYIRFREKSSVHLIDVLKSAQFIGIGFLLAISTMANYWDFVIYLVVSIFVLVILFAEKPSLLSLTLGLGHFVLIFISYLFLAHAALQVLAFTLIFSAGLWLYKRFPGAWIKISTMVSALFLVSHLLAIPFNLYFEPMSKSFKLVSTRSGLFSLFILWSSHVLIALLFVLCTYLFRETNTWKPTTDVFLFILVVSAIGLIAAPEVLYVQDIYEGAYTRANTMFKFTYQSFVMLSLVAIYFLGNLTQRLLPKKSSLPNTVSTTNEELELPRRYRGDRVNRKTNGIELRAIVPLALASLLTLIPFRYTSSIFSWYGPLKPDEIIGLEGTTYYSFQNIMDENTIAHSLEDRHTMTVFLNMAVEGQPVILEAYGPSYSQYNVISAYTGLPTVIGWQTHEWLWRSSSTEADAFANIVRPLQDEVRQIYEARTLLDANPLIQKHNISYIVVGEMERIQFPNINEELLKSLGEIIFQGKNENYILKLY